MGSVQVVVLCAIGALRFQLLRVIGLAEVTRPLLTTALVTTKTKGMAMKYMHENECLL